MMTEKYEWWDIKRCRYNKGLAISGLIVLLITFLTFYLHDNSFDNVVVFTIGLPVYFAYMAGLNSIFLLFEVIDRRYNIVIDNKTRDTFFRFFYLFSIGLPFIYPAFICYQFWHN